MRSYSICLSLSGSFLIMPSESTYVVSNGQGLGFGCAGMWDFGSLTRDRTCAPCIGSVESSPLDYQGSPRIFFFNLRLNSIFIIYDMCVYIYIMHYIFFICSSTSGHLGCFSTSAPVIMLL